MYADDDAWRRVQALVPAHLRAGGDRAPAEEWWSWEGHGIHLDRYADPAAPVKVVALHGGGGNGRLMGMVGVGARGLAETVAPDLPGYGYTELAGGSAVTYDLWVAMATDLVEAELARDGRPVVLVGASMGGLLAYDVAESSGRVIAVAATCLLDPADPAAVRAAVRRPAMVHAVPLLRTLDPLLGRVRVPMRWLANMRAIANDPSLVDALVADRTGAGVRVPLRFLTSFLASRRPVAPEDSTTPVLLVHPAEDRWTPPEVSLRFLGRVAAPTRHVPLENCGHLPVEEPGLTQLTDALRDLITRVARGADPIPA